MKHPIHRQTRSGGREWISALTTLLILSGVFLSLENEEPAQNGMAEGSSATVSKPYWNDVYAYGFRGEYGDSYRDTSITGRSRVEVRNEDSDRLLRVTYYPDTSVEILQDQLDASIPRAFSQLRDGVAVIEGDLNSPSAKTILATLHTR